jgi:hypothetical protein
MPGRRQCTKSFTIAAVAIATLFFGCEASLAENRCPQGWVLRTTGLGCDPAPSQSPEEPSPEEPSPPPGPSPPNRFLDGCDAVYNGEWNMQDDSAYDYEHQWNSYGVSKEGDFWFGDELIFHLIYRTVVGDGQNAVDAVYEFWGALAAGGTGQMNPTASHDDIVIKFFANTGHGGLHIHANGDYIAVTSSTCIASTAMR